MYLRKNNSKFPDRKNLKETFIWELWLGFRFLLDNTFIYVAQNSKGTKGYTENVSLFPKFVFPQPSISLLEENSISILCVYVSKDFYAHKNTFFSFFTLMIAHNTNFSAPCIFSITLYLGYYFIAVYKEISTSFFLTTAWYHVVYHDNICLLPY